jgi:hypothetical protein
VFQRGKRWAALAAVAAAMCTAGCMPPNRTEFIEKLAAENRTIARSSRPFLTAIKPLFAGQSADASGAHSAYDDMVKAVKTVKGDMAVQMLPPASSAESHKAAKDLLDAYKDYLDAEQKILDGPMKQILDKVDDNSSIGEKGDVIKGLMDEVKSQDDAAFKDLTQAQQNYCSVHNYQANTLEQYKASLTGGK